MCVAVDTSSVMVFSSFISSHFDSTAVVGMVVDGDLSVEEGGEVAEASLCCC